MEKTLSSLLFLLFLNCCFANQKTIEFNEFSKIIEVGGKVEVFTDSSNQLSFEQVKNETFKPVKNIVPNLETTTYTHWVRFEIKNNTNIEDLLLEFSYPTIDLVNFYQKGKEGWEVTRTGESIPYYNRKYLDPNFRFDCKIQKGKKKIYYFELKSSDAIQLPIIFGTKDAIFEFGSKRLILSGVYFGLMLVMIFYNLFIYTLVKDKSYIYYVIYSVIILLTQTTLQGYPFKYLWPSSPILAKYSIFFFPALVGIAALLFMNEFLKTKKNLPTYYKISHYLFIPYFLALVLCLLGNFKFSYKLIEITAGIVSLFMLVVAVIMVNRKYEAARYFLVAWVIFLIGVIVYILKDLGVLPFNNFTRYTMQIGSAIEAVLLSFALASKINSYKKDRLEALLVNQKIVREQNVILEQKVTNRTRELNSTLMNLKQAQSKLVEAEKMSSLGLLTAGIAHEINNPINFVSSNIHPLRQDINDFKTILNEYEKLQKFTSSEVLEEKLKEIEELKKELDYQYLKEELDIIINGIEEGASRTAEIVRGLRTFSRIDENELSKVDVNEGIESTLILVRNKTKDIEILKELGDIPKVFCNAGKLNQLFMNLIDNAIYAVKDINEKGRISIKSDVKSNDKHKVFIQITDNGKGISADIMNKIFDPFFTTKDVGEGTGLGLSIVKSIVDEMEGQIKVESAVGQGTTITLILNNEI